MITVWKGQSANRKLNFNLFIIKVTLLIIDFTLRPGFISQLPHCPAPRPHRPLPSAPAHGPNGAHGAVGMHGAPPGLPVPEDGVQVTRTQRPPCSAQRCSPRDQAPQEAVPSLCSQPGASWSLPPHWHTTGNTAPHPPKKDDPIVPVSN